MNRPPEGNALSRRVPLGLLTLALAVLAGLTSVRPSEAHPDVYAVLPGDTQVLSYHVGDVDGDARDELAVLYRSAQRTALALFRGEAGHWRLWWEDGGDLQREDGLQVDSVDLVDTNRDGRMELLTYYLGKTPPSLVARILTLDGDGQGEPVFTVLLEDLTAPPGYPLLGTEGSAPSVTFLNMTPQGDSGGYRRVYCWDGSRFENCLEVQWEKP